jgi:hypothetical protein
VVVELFEQSPYTLGHRTLDVEINALPDPEGRREGHIESFALEMVNFGGYGSAAAAYGVLAGSLRRPHALYGLPFGAAVWASGYVVLPEAGLYKPIWEYDAKTLARDLTAASPTERAPEPPSGW